MRESTIDPCLVTQATSRRVFVLSFSVNVSILAPGHGPLWWVLQVSKQIQQNSLLHFRHVMWLQPPFLLISDLHFGHCLQFCAIQLAEGKSFALSCSNLIMRSQEIKSWTKCEQEKQKWSPHEQRTAGCLIISIISMAFVHCLPGHQRIILLLKTNSLVMSWKYLPVYGASSVLIISSSDKIVSHL